MLISIISHFDGGNNLATPAQYRHGKQSELLLYTTVGSILSLIPTTRFIASLTTRSIALVSLTTRDNFECGKIVAVSMGIIGVATGSAILVITSLFYDILARLVNNPCGWNLISVIVIDSLAITAMLTGSWHVICIASIVSAIAMIITAVTQDDIFDGICYFAMGVIGIVGAISVVEWRSSTATKAHFKIHNPFHKTMQITVNNRLKNVIAEVQPGETIEITRPVEDCGGDPNSIFGHSCLHKFGLYGRAHVVADSYDYDIKLIQSPMRPEDFPTLPITSTVIVS